MKIEFIHIHNFRKLKSCRIALGDKETVFVGPNNSGKTSAMDAMVTFFKAKDFTTRDFTMSNWTELNKLAADWEAETDPPKRDRTLVKWESLLPAMDIWLLAEASELHNVMHLIPSIHWTGGALGVRLRFQPKDMDVLCNEFCGERDNSKALVGNASYTHWPKHLLDYLDKESILSSHFEIVAYLLDPDHKDDDLPQPLPANAEPLEQSAFNGLIKVDTINAQRGFSDVNSEGDTSKAKRLSTQLKLYYEKHLNPSLKPTANDIQALEAIEGAKKNFDENLNKSFTTSLKELKDLNYPGFGSPSIKLSSRLTASETINHDAAVYYDLADGLGLSLPEKYNGLGYQNLISMVFQLIRFRDEWMQVGKAAKNTSVGGTADGEFEPLHLVLIEEPEAHLHAQVQQVFIKQAYKVLRNHPDLGTKTDFTTQLVISTHSNHIAHEIDFTTLRYFKRSAAVAGSVATSSVVNLSKTFGTNNDTTKFAKRYLKTTHCDLFFADAVILVEGPAEKILVPYFIMKHEALNVCYLSILEIGGSHAHTLKPLIESLGIITLVITDIDASDGKGKTPPAKGKGLISGNDTLKTWFPKEKEFDKLVALVEQKKNHPDYPIKMAYQSLLKIADGQKTIDVYPYTFEDCLVMENKEIFKKLKGSKGLLKKMVDAASEKDIAKSATAMYDAINAHGAKKAEFALELLYLEEPDVLSTPTYIKEGLKWLEEKLIASKLDSITAIATTQA